MRRTANIYVDGFNLYYRRLRDSPEAKWLDLRALFELLLSRLDIRAVHYFTARIHSRYWDPEQPGRQDRYLRALQSTGVNVHLGTFRTDPTLLPLAANPNALVEVLRTVEKGSDVNLATQLLVDAHRNVADQYWVVSRDSDLVAPLRAVGNLGRYVGLLGPTKRASKDLLPVVAAYKPIRMGPVLASQLPDVVQTSDGPVHRPPEWSSHGVAESRRQSMTISVTVRAVPDESDTA